jgi:hypothetical protein
MNRLGFLVYAAQFGPRLLQVRRSTWLGLGIGLVVLAGLFVWAALALTGWFLGQAQGWFGSVKETASGPARAVLAQAEQVAPGVVQPLREQLGEYLPRLESEAAPLRDVSGSDPGPVSRFPGLVRSYWHREGRAVTVEYEGRAGYGAVLDHYAQGFAAAGFTAEVQSASREMEVHQYTQAQERYLVRFSHKTGGMVSVRLATSLGTTQAGRTSP